MIQEKSGLGISHNPYLWYLVIFWNNCKFLSYLILKQSFHETTECFINRHFVKWLVYCMAIAYTHTDLLRKEGRSMVSVLSLLHFLLPILPSLLWYPQPGLLFSAVLYSSFLWFLEQQKAVAVYESWDKCLCHVSSDIGTGVHMFFCSSLFVWSTVWNTLFRGVTCPHRIIWLHNMGIFHCKANPL